MKKAQGMGLMLQFPDPGRMFLTGWKSIGCVRARKGTAVVTAGWRFVVR